MGLVVFDEASWESLGEVGGSGVGALAGGEGECDGCDDVDWRHEGWRDSVAGARKSNRGCWRFRDVLQANGRVHRIAEDMASFYCAIERAIVPVGESECSHCSMLSLTPNRASELKWLARRVLGLSLAGESNVPRLLSSHVPHLSPLIAPSPLTTGLATPFPRLSTGRHHRNTRAFITDDLHNVGR